MTSFLSGDSTFLDDVGNSIPVFNSPLIVQETDGGISANLAVTGVGVELTIIGDSETIITTDQIAPHSDNITSGDSHELKYKKVYP